MAIFKNANFDERRSTAEAAKEAKLQKFRALTAEFNENAAERLTARKAIIAARDVRAGEREAARRATEARAAEDQAARALALKAEQEERDTSAVEQAERENANAAQRKAAREILPKIKTYILGNAATRHPSSYEI
ncbi:DUF6481 family protein [Methylocystis rosea]|uniref:DUF6481 family protein n=1 Tax=Methylocystis rosea TaxID=173366 RepID=UPI000366D404|nr:DUF6481 family protein [Methylocystis rosea]